MSTKNATSPARADTVSAVASVQTITVSVAGLSSRNEEAFAGGEARL